MIDWLTLRVPIGSGLSDYLADKLMGAACLITCTNLQGRVSDSDGIIWEKVSYDFEKLRSDMPGLFWTVQSAGQRRHYLVIGGSPASIEHGCNVFGSNDIRHGADVLVRHAMKVLRTTLPLPSDPSWECRRIDVTNNYLLPSFDAVKAGLRYLMASDRARRFPGESAKNSDTVGWNVGSDLRSGKAYHKGPQLQFLAKQGKTTATAEQIEMANRLLRLELRLGRRWCERLTQKCLKGGRWVERDMNDPARRHWYDLTENELLNEFETFFQGFFGDVEVRDMGDLLEQLKAVCPSEGYALAAHRTWALIKALGHEQAKASMPLRTWQKHTKFLREAGLSDMDLSSAQILEFRLHRVKLAKPVESWDEIRRAA